MPEPSRQPMIELDPGQREALEAITNGVSTWVSGPAGSGKSLLIHRLCEELPADHAAFVAPTGMAARAVRGVTIHSLIGQPPVDYIPPNAPVELTAVQRETLGCIRWLIVDEISMVSADVFAAIDRAMRAVRDRDRPFGGCCVAVLGDLGQLPPPASREARFRLATEYGGRWACQTACWHQLEFRTVPLRRPHRQGGDPWFRNFLSRLRLFRPLSISGTLEMEPLIRQFNEAVHLTVQPPPGLVVICPRRDDVDRINRERDALLPGALHRFRAERRGDLMGFSVPSPDQLELRLGSRVLVTANRRDVRGRMVHVNGDLGVVAAIDDDALSVTVDLDSGRKVTVRSNTWENCRYVPDGNGGVCLETLGSVRQIPLLLASALTAHRAQGCTLDAVHIDFGARGFFDHGHAYCALSRVRRMADLSMSRPLRPNDMSANEKFPLNLLAGSEG